jgi:hypothetical protein
MPDGHKMYQHLPSQHPSKFTQIGIFGLKTNHLATQITTSLKLSSLSRKPRRMQIFLANSSEKNGKKWKAIKILPFTSRMGLQIKLLVQSFGINRRVLSCHLTGR